MMKSTRSFPKARAISVVVIRAIMAAALIWCVVKAGTLSDSWPMQIAVDFVCVFIGIMAFACPPLPWELRLLGYSKGDITSYWDGKSR
jgi:hypothetical protein